MRASALTWNLISKKVGIKAKTIACWPKRYEADWQLALKLAFRELAIESKAESIHTLRQKIRNPEDKSSNQAARVLLQFSKDQLNETDSIAEEQRVAEMADYLLKLNDSELDDLFASIAKSRE